MSRIAKRSLDSIVLLFLSGATLLAFFVILCGAKKTGVLRKFYWIRVDTSNITTAAGRGETYWLNYMYCTKANSSQSDYSYCSGKKPAYPFSPRENFGSVANLPSAFNKSKNKFYYLSRVGWSMWLVGLFFLVVGLLPFVLQSCIKHTAVYIISTMSVWAAWFYLTLGACLWTSAFVIGKHDFTNDGISAKLGVKMFAFLWTTVFLISVAALWQPISAILSKKHNNATEQQNKEIQQGEYVNDLENGQRNNDYSSETDSYLNNGQPKYGKQSDYSDYNSNENAVSSPTDNQAKKSHLFGFQKKVKHTKINTDGEKKTNVTKTAGILNVPFHKGNDSTAEYVTSGGQNGVAYNEPLSSTVNDVPNDNLSITKENVPSGIPTN